MKEVEVKCFRIERDAAANAILAGVEVGKEGYKYPLAFYDSEYFFISKEEIGVSYNDLISNISISGEDIDLEDQLDSNREIELENLLYICFGYKNVKIHLHDLNVTLILTYRYITN